MTDTSKPTLLIVDDDAELVRILKAVLASLDVQLATATTVRQVLQLLDESVPAVMLLDMRLPDAPGLDILTELRRRGVPCTVIAMTAHGTVDVAVEAMRNGAHDFLTKPLDLERLQIMVRHALERHRLIAQLDDFANNTERMRFRALIGSSPAMQRLYRGIQANAPGLAPILMLGPQGAEFSEVARTIHGESGVAEALFAELDVALLDAKSFQSTLFGSPEADGTLKRVAGGTVFLRNVDKLDRAAQAILLKYLRTGEGPDGRVGAQEPRILSSAHAEFTQGYSAAGFDEDLYVSLATILLRIPSLNNRGEDVLELAQHFLEIEAKRWRKPVLRMADDVEEALMVYAWPGDVVELRQAISEGVQASTGATVRLESLPQTFQAAVLDRLGRNRVSTTRLSEAQSVIRPLWQTEREEIEKALKLCDGSVLEAARLLQVSPGTIYRKQRAWQAIGKRV